MPIIMRSLETQTGCGRCSSCHSAGEAELSAPSFTTLTAAFNISA